MPRVQEDPIRVEGVVGQVASGADGAVAVFLGSVRDHHDGRRVRFLEYHAYAEMAEAAMERIEREAVERFGASRVAIAHRIGRLEIGEVSVCVAVASPHRAQAIDACRFAIESLKRIVPIWKKEHFDDAAAWIEGDDVLPAR